MIRLIVIGVAAVVSLVVFLFNMHSDPANAAQGDCIGNLPTSQTGSVADVPQAKKIDCTDSSAQFKVVGVVNDPSGNEIEDDTARRRDCGAFAGYDTAYEQSSQDGGGTLLCLETIKH